MMDLKFFPEKTSKQLQETLQDTAKGFQKGLLAAYAIIPISRAGILLAQQAKWIPWSYSINLYDLFAVAIVAPIEEEILFRGIIQDLLLTRLAKRTLKNYAPGQEGLLDTPAAKAARIGLTTLLFSISHYTNILLMPSFAVKVQMVNAFVSGK